MDKNSHVSADLIDKALALVCKRGGYCTYLTATSLLKKYQNNVTAEHFATAVLFAEGLDTKYSEGRELIERIFLDCVELSNKHIN